MIYSVYFAVAKTFVQENTKAINDRDYNYLTSDLTNTIMNVVEFERMTWIQEIQKLNVRGSTEQQIAINSVIAIIRKGGAM